MMKEVKAVVEVGPNYIFHLMAVAKIGYDSEYADQHGDSIASGDMEILQRYRKELSFRDGRGGELAYLLIFFPTYLNLNTRELLEEYFSLLSAGLAASDCSAFVNRYTAAIECQREWTHAIDGEWIAQNHSAYREALAQIGEIYLRNFDRYVAQVWPNESPKIQQVADDLNLYLSAADLIGRWESLLGLEFRIHPYEIVLCSAIKNGPSANSLGYERNVFYSGYNTQYLRQFISHEVGTHILFPTFKGVVLENDQALSYKAFENLARFYNSVILGTKDLYPMNSFYDADVFFRIYDAIYREKPQVSPMELAQTGTSVYMTTIQPISSWY